METLEQIMKYFLRYGKNADGSVSRIFGSDAYYKTALLMKKYMHSLNMESYIDPVGNVHGIYPAGTDETDAEVIVGSHLDTVKDGGVFDGLLGVSAGLECVARLQKNARKLPFRIHVIATNGEEGNVLGGTFGSRCLAGAFSDEYYNAVGGEAVLKNLVVDKMSNKALDMRDIKKARLDLSRTLCYLELHIEQGNTLERKQKEIGVVTGIVGLKRYKITVSGTQNHSGTTRMEYRDDALVKAAKFIVYIDELAKSFQNEFTATFQKISAKPNILAVINSKVTMILEIRSLKEEQMSGFERMAADKCKELGKIEMTPVTEKRPVKTSPLLVKMLSGICEKEKYSSLLMPSGATHDANMMALKIPVGMIFVPSRGGKSHSKEEWTDMRQCVQGTQVLYDAILKLEEEYMRDPGLRQKLKKDEIL